MKTKKINGLKYVLGAFFIYTVLLPLLRMFLYIKNVNLAAIFGSPLLWKAIENSLKVSSVASLISIIIAMALAFCIGRSKIRGKSAFHILITLPMLIPSISHGMGLVILLGENGILRKWLHLPGSLYGFWGIVIGSVLYSFPLAFLMLVNVLKYEDASSYDAATILGISRGRQFLSITLPYLYKPLISVVFATFAVIVTDYGVPLMIGGQCTTLPVLMYQEVIGLLNFGKGSAIGLILLIPALLSFVLDTASKDSGNLNYVIQPFEPKKNQLVETVSYGACLLVSLCVLLPIGAFVLLTFVQKYPLDMQFTLSNITQSFDLGAGKYLVNSLIISFFVVVVGVSISYITAYLTARSPGKSSSFLHLISLTSLAIPGIVLGLSYVLFFKGSFLFGTLSILILVNMMHFFASPYLIAYNSLGKINQNLEDVGATLGIGRLRILWCTLIPQTWSAILEMAAYFFVNSMITISAVSFLSSVNNKPLAMMIPTFEGHMKLESAAFVSLLILLCNLLMKGMLASVRQVSQKGE